MRDCKDRLFQNEQICLKRLAQEMMLCLLIVICFMVSDFADGAEPGKVKPIVGTAAQEQYNGKENKVESQIEEILSGLSLEEKVAQLFVITPEALTGIADVTAAGPLTEESYSEYPIGGIIYMGNNIQTWEQTSQMLSSMQKISMKRIGLPVFLTVDEEGGSVCRVSGRVGNVPYIPDMYSVGNTGDPGQAYQSGSLIGEYLRQLGFNVDFAPVADVLTNPENTVIGDRSFGPDAYLVADMVSMEVMGLHGQKICATLKHFPGHGNTYEDSHLGMAVSYKTLEELRNCEFLPFESGIQAGAEFVMAGHVAMPNVTGNDVPASLSHTMLTDILRGELGFDGIIITDALEMGAIVNVYGSAEASVKAILAGSDMLLAPNDFHEAYRGVLDAVTSGIISEERLEDSLWRIIGLKVELINKGSVTDPIIFFGQENDAYPSDPEGIIGEDSEW